MGEVQVRFNDSAVREIMEQVSGAAAITYMAEYAPYVEFPTSYTGTQPPFEPIFTWVDQKWPDLDSSLKTDAEGEPLSRKSVAWKVVTIIAEHGTDGVHFGGRSVERMRENAEAFARQYEGSDDPQAGRKLLEDIADFGFEHSQDIIAREATNTGQLLQSGSVEFTQDPEEVGKG